MSKRFKFKNKILEENSRFDTQVVEIFLVKIRSLEVIKENIFGYIKMKNLSMIDVIKIQIGYSLRSYF